MCTLFARTASRSVHPFCSDHWCAQHIQIAERESLIALGRIYATLPNKHCRNDVSVSLLLGAIIAPTVGRWRQFDRLLTSKQRARYNNNNNTNHGNVYVAVIVTKVIARVHPVHLMNAH